MGQNKAKEQQLGPPLVEHEQFLRSEFGASFMSTSPPFRDSVPVR